MKTRVIFLATFLTFLSLTVKSQDFIFKKNREVLRVKIIEVGTSEISFKDYDDPEGPTFVVEKERVSKIEFENGDVMEIKMVDRFNDPDYYSDQSKNALKWSFSSIMFRHLDFSYERSLTPSSSYEVGLGIIGIGFNPTDQYYGEEANRKPFGIALRGGYKFKKSPDYYLDKMRYGHILKGGYIKPELILTMYSENVNYSFYDHTNPNKSEYRSERKGALAGALMLNFGKQNVFSDRFILDYYIGIGYAFTTSKNYSGNYLTDDTGNPIYPNTNGVSQYSFTIFESVPIAISTGISFGYVFGK